eukprot:TRINITY_DN7724_c4_g1_i1.p1 TRINITY_DN7724_c4_g1~~TRINITY_DN7724_c4_g1_i1.p1  ORF type:complete len:637 (+),score=180.69 TRINITY_DN7724_c4_g1_i1:143-2053(+)
MAASGSDGVHVISVSEKEAGASTDSTNQSDTQQAVKRPRPVPPPLPNPPPSAVPSAFGTPAVAGLVSGSMVPDDESDSRITVHHVQGVVDESTIEKLEQLFRSIDKDGSGTLSYYELQALWKGIFPSMPSKDIERLAARIFEDIDVDGSDEIDFSELTRYLSGQDSDADSDLAEIVGTGLHFKFRPVAPKEWVWAVFENSAGLMYSCPKVRLCSNLTAFVTQLVILVSIVNMMVETLPQYLGSDGDIGTKGSYRVEFACVSVFTIEFVGRCIGAPSARAYWMELFTWIDLLAILPFYLTSAGALQEGGKGDSLLVLRVLRLLRLARVLRVLKLGRHSQGIQLMFVAFKRARVEMVWMLAVVAMQVVLFAALVFYVEKEDGYFDSSTSLWRRKLDSTLGEPGERLDFQSIPDAMWWALVTLCTVGYGDQAPVTGWGKLIGSCCMIAGLLLIAYPVTLLTNTFGEVFAEFRRLKAKRDRRHQFQRKIETQGRILKGRKSHGGGSSPAPCSVPILETSTTSPRHIRNMVRSPGCTTSGSFIDGHLHHSMRKRTAPDVYERLLHAVQDLQREQQFLKEHVMKMRFAEGPGAHESGARKMTLVSAGESVRTDPAMASVSEPVWGHDHGGLIHPLAAPTLAE